MKDEEMAEEYAEKHSFRVPYDGSNKFYDDTDFKASKDGFLAGLKAGRPQWHDLRKAPNDLPKDDNYVLVSNGKDWTKAFYKDKKWNIICLVGFTKIIAWCEIPKYTEV